MARSSCRRGHRCGRRHGRLREQWGPIAVEFDPSRGISCNCGGRHLPPSLHAPRAVAAGARRCVTATLLIAAAAWRYRRPTLGSLTRCFGPAAAAAGYVCVWLDADVQQCAARDATRARAVGAGTVRAVAKAAQPPDPAAAGWEYRSAAAVRVDAEACTGGVGFGSVELLPRPPSVALAYTHRCGTRAGRRRRRRRRRRWRRQGRRWCLHPHGLRQR